jgi:hypothetical protein
MSSIASISVSDPFAKTNGLFLYVYSEARPVKLPHFLTLRKTDFNLRTPLGAGSPAAVRDAGFSACTTTCDFAEPLLLRAITACPANAVPTNTTSAITPAFTSRLNPAMSKIAFIAAKKSSAAWHSNSTRAGINSHNAPSASHNAGITSHSAAMASISFLSLATNNLHPSYRAPLGNTRALMMSLEPAFFQICLCQHRQILPPKILSLLTMTIFRILSLLTKTSCR